MYTCVCAPSLTKRVYGHIHLRLDTHARAKGKCMQNMSKMGTSAFVASGFLVRFTYPSCSGSHTTRWLGEKDQKAERNKGGCAHFAHFAHILYFPSTRACVSGRKCICPYTCLGRPGVIASECLLKHLRVRAVHPRLWIHVCASARTFMNTSTYTCVHMHMHTHTHLYTYVFTYALNTYLCGC